MTRGPLVESQHRVRACIADDRGTIVAAYGDIDAATYLRSAAKPFIAAEIVRAGTADAFGFGDCELAVIAASHNGEPFHLDAVRSVLAKAGVDASALRCGAHPPSYDPAARALAAGGEPFTQLHNNCSGKHAGILALCAHAGYSLEGYLEPQHPVQRRILAFCARMTGDDAATWPLGIDGCGIPVFATSLRRAATAFARFATLGRVADDDAAALERVRTAMLAEPAHVAGTARFDTALMVAAAGTVACKAGAEGVHASASLARSLGSVLKVEDGSRRAAAPAALHALREVRALDARALHELGPFAAPRVCNVAGRDVGSVSVAPG